MLHMMYVLGYGQLGSMPTCLIYIILTGLYELLRGFKGFMAQWREVHVAQAHGGPRER